MDHVEIEVRHRWVCPSCGQVHLSRPVIAELSPEERAEIEEETGRPVEPGEWCVARKTVKCKRCGSRFKTIHSETE